MIHGSLPLALPRRKTPMPIQRMPKNLRKTNSHYRRINNPEAIILRVPVLHVKNRHSHRRMESHRSKTNRVPDSLRLAGKVRPLLWIPKCPSIGRAAARRMPNLPKNTSMQPTQKINLPFRSPNRFNPCFTEL